MKNTITEPDKNEKNDNAMKAFRILCEVMAKHCKKCRPDEFEDVTTEEISKYVHQLITTSIVEQKEKNLIEHLPYKLGEKIYVVSEADCKLGDCGKADTKECVYYNRFQSPTVDVDKCRIENAYVHETTVEEYDIKVAIDYSENEEQIVDILINGWIRMEATYSSEKEALEALQKLKTLQ